MKLGIPKVRSWKLMAAALAVFVLGAALDAWIILSDRTLHRSVAPEASEFEISEPGSYSVFHEYRGTIDGHAINNPRDLGGLQVRMVSLATGQEVQLERYAGESTYSYGEKAGTAVHQFEILLPGRFRLESSYPDGAEGPARILLVMQTDPFKVIWAFVVMAIGVLSGSLLTFRAVEFT